PRIAVVREERVVHPPRLHLRVADDADAHPHGALDLGLVTADLAAVATQDLVLVLDAPDAPADVAHVGVEGDRSEGSPLSPTPDQQRHARLQGWWVVADGAGRVELVP